MRRGNVSPILVVLAGFVVCALAARPSSVQPARPSAASRPTLVVMLVVDQMRADYVTRYGHQWHGGLRRLIDAGAWFEQAIYPYAYTVTCAGHATISTGAFPRTHGITGNSWWDRASGRSVDCTADAAERTISYGRPVQGGESIGRLALPTFTDTLRAYAVHAPRIVTMSMKQRTAIMLAGHRATAVTWFDVPSGSFVTSSAYAAAPVPFVEAFIKAHPIDADLESTWTPRRPAASYLYEDAAGGERPPAFWTATFPHALRRPEMKPQQPYAAWEESPFSDAYLGRLAENAVETLRLGSGPGTDYVGISFSALDAVGHDFGPMSREVQDVLVRLDETLASLFATLDRRVGRSRYIVALTGDHGVSPIPEQMAALGIPAGRITTSTITEAAEGALRGSLGSEKAVARTSGGQVYLTAAAREAVAGDARARAAFVAALERVPGVARVLLTAERDRWSDTDAIARAVRLSYFPDRAGDVVVVPRPYWLYGADAANHGTPNRYDAWVPLFLYGNGIKAGHYREAVSPADVAPTLAWSCGVTIPHPDGRPLVEALRPAYTPR